MTGKQLEAALKRLNAQATADAQVAAKRASRKHVRRDQARKRRRVA